ncbi:MmcQ/YjbR family DNA-binding protein [Streptomyces sp. NPDC048438]|uniref:MmcQ/YjbR family DNA-binding protein n=1 Tax=Streptomyces sp. NPDC048438 TaxID=3365551 RepID=UPI0037211B2A
MTLTGARLQQAARRAAEALPSSGSSRPFTEKLDVYKVAGKVFLIVTDDPDERIITVKADPEHGRRLREEHPSITAGRYLDKTHWVSVGAGPGITAALVENLVTDSYDLVLGSASRSRRTAGA